MFERRPPMTVYVVRFHAEDCRASVSLGRVLYDRLCRPREDLLAYGGPIRVFGGLLPEHVDLDGTDSAVIVAVVGEAADPEKVRRAFAEWSAPAPPGQPPRSIRVLLLARHEGVETTAAAEDVFQVPGHFSVRGIERAPWLDRFFIRLARQICSGLASLGDPSKPALAVSTTKPADASTSGASKSSDSVEPLDRVRLFLSYASPESQKAKEAAGLIKEHAESAFGDFFELHDLAEKDPLREAPEPLEAIKEARGAGVLIAIRGDRYSLRPWCREQLQFAKRFGLTVLTVEALDRGEARSMAYGGNSANLRWEGSPSSVLQQALAELIRDQAFFVDAGKIEQAAELEVLTESLDRDTGLASYKSGYLTRPPELFDWSWRFRDARGIVLHPDPELPVLERETLRRANPALHLATPSSALAPVLRRKKDAHELESAPAAGKQEDSEEKDSTEKQGGKAKSDPLEGRSNPLHGQKLAISLSESPGVGGPEGFHKEHVWDAVLAICRSVVSAGSKIAYGGDWRSGGYTQKLGALLVQLIETYNRAKGRPADFLHNYLAAHVKPAPGSGDASYKIHQLRLKDYPREIKVSPISSGKVQEKALWLSDMRRFMTCETEARVILGGEEEPQDDETREAEGSKKKGYSGRFPGIVEEAWWSLKLEKPLYVVGGYGGAAGLVAELLEAALIQGPLEEIPEMLRDEHWRAKQHYGKFVGLMDGFDSDPSRKTLGLPGSMGEMAVDIHKRLQYLVEDQWNGLSREENLRLARSRDPLEIAFLITKGLLEVRRERFRELTNKNIELVHGSITDVETLDGIAISVLDGQPLGGAGAAINDLLGGRATLARGHGSALLDIDSNVIDADWLFLASFGQPTSLFSGKCKSSESETCCTKALTEWPPAKSSRSEPSGASEVDETDGSPAAQERSVEAEPGDAEVEDAANSKAAEPRDLGPFGQKIVGLGKQVKEVAGRHGFRRLGIVTFGASLVIGNDDAEGWIEAVAEKILDGFGDSLKEMTLFWFETDQQRYEALRAYLEKDQRIALTTRVIPPTDDWGRPEPVGSAAGGSKQPDGDYWLHVSLDGIRLETVLLPPAGRGPARSCCSSFWQDELDDLASESPAEWQSRRVRIERLLLGEKGLKQVDPQSRLMVVHDDACSRIPFELLRPPAVAEEKDGEEDGQKEVVDQAGQPAVGAGVCRFLSTVDPSLHTVLRRPPRSADLRLLLVAVDALENLPGIEAEAKQIRKILFPEHEDAATSVRLRLLVDDQVTRENFLKLLGEADILHFTGHAFFDGGGADESGLLLWKREKLTVREMQEKHLPTRLAFVNSCKTGRVAGETGEDQASTFARIFLRSGIEAYLGTYWNVGDKAATAFAGSVYRRLNEGKTLGEAVSDARGRLRRDEQPDWANYRLFGDGRLQFKK